MMWQQIQCRLSLLLVLLLLFFQFQISALIEKCKPALKYDEAVSLGTACQPAWHLQGYGIRKNAYPFDWLVTPFTGLMAFIQNRGEGFLEKENIQIAEILPGNPPMLHVVDVVYDIHSIHDFLHPEMRNYDHIKAKYDRRIQRFFKLLESNKKVLFVRVQMNRHEAIELDDLLHTLYPHLEYTLVAVSDDPDAQTDWKLERVKNFYMKQTAGDWQGDGNRWKEILSQFPIKEINKKSPGDVKW